MVVQLFLVSQCRVILLQPSASISCHRLISSASAGCANRLNPYTLQGKDRYDTNRSRTRCLSLKSGELPSRTFEKDKQYEVMDSVKKMAFIPILEEGVYRFDHDVEARKNAFPSISFLNQRDRDSIYEASTENAPQYIPTSECVAGQQVVTIELPQGTSFYGTGEVSGPLERTGKRVFAWNTDAWGYGNGTTSLYQSHPWVLAILPNGEGYGILADTTRRCEIDLRKDSYIKFSASAVYPVITFGPFPTPVEVMRSLSHATGTLFMPPKWALGYHQCRWSYATDSRVMEVATNFRERQLPCDAIWMDIDYMDGFRCFTFDSSRFPNPKSLANNLHSKGFKAVWMIDPGIKKDEGYQVYDSGCLNDVWVLNAEGKSYVGKVWPGKCVFPDFTQEKCRTWWAKLVSDLIPNGVDGIWNDMNEPAVFKTVTKTMPDSNIHRGDKEMGGHQQHIQYHNVYGMLMARSTYEGMLLANPKKRPFVLTRAGYIGSQRYAATWTGDNLSTWEHLHMSVTMALNLGLSGQPLSGPDIGGFAGNATAKLFARWMGIGTMLPFSRGHSEARTKDHEPWVFGAECEKVCQLALQRRYRLLPHIYTLFYQAHTKGDLVMSPLFFCDPKDPQLRAVEDAFLLGPLLVTTSTAKNENSQTKKAILPKGVWMQFDFEDTHPDLPLLYLQGGSIIPLGSCIQHVGEATLNDDLTLVVALDEKGRAEGILFEDDGDGYEYQTGNFLLTHYVAELSSSVVTVTVDKAEGLWERPKRKLNVQLLLGDYAKIEACGLDGDAIEIEIPSTEAIAKLISESQNQTSTRLAEGKRPPDEDEHFMGKGSELSWTPIDVEGGEWHLKLVPWIGGRIISMTHVPSRTQWLHSRVEINGYEEYSATEYRSAGCTEQYNVIEHGLEKAGEQELLVLEGDIGGGLVIQREIHLPKDRPKVVRIESNIIAKSVGAGSGGFSRLVCLRVHPTFTLVHPTEILVKFTSLNGTEYEVGPEIGDKFFEGNDRPNGEWMLWDRCEGLALLNRFNLSEVSRCFIFWGSGTCNLELWSEERPVSKDTPLKVYHEYEVIEMQKS